MDEIEDRPNRCELEAPKLEGVCGDWFVVHAVFCEPRNIADAEVSHIELHARGHLWLARPWNGLISDPVQTPCDRL